MIVSEGDVREALRTLHNGNVFPKLRIARYANRLHPGNTAREAFVALVEGALESQPASKDTVQMSEVIFKCDIEQTLQRETAASSLGMSSRSLFRKRARAVRLITAYFNDALDRVLDIDDSLESALRTTQRRSEVTVAKSQLPSVRMSFSSNRLRGDLRAMEADISRLALRRNSLSSADKAEVSIMESEVQLYSGCAMRAWETLEGIFRSIPALQSYRVTQLALLARARVCFALGHLHEAHTLTEAVLGADHSDEETRSAAHALRGRIGVLTGTGCDSLREPAPNVADRLSVRASKSRNGLRQGAVCAAREASLEVFEEAMRCGLFPIAAYSAASLSACYSVSGSTSRDRWVLQALRLYASCDSNPFVAADLFQFPGIESESVRWLDSGIESEMAQLYINVCPANRLGASETFREALPLLLRGIFERVWEQAQPIACVDELIELVWQDAEARDRAVSVYCDELRNLIAFGEFLKVVYPAGHQSIFARKYRSAAANVVRSITRSIGYRNLRNLSIVS